jgi:hypothetical protein
MELQIANLGYLLSYWVLHGTTFSDYSLIWVSTPLFLEDENIFQKSASMVPILLQFPMEPWRPILELDL